MALVNDKTGLCEELTSQRCQRVLYRAINTIFTYRLFEQYLLEQTHQISGHHHGVQRRLGGPEVA